MFNRKYQAAVSWSHLQDIKHSIVTSFLRLFSCIRVLTASTEVLEENRTALDGILKSFPPALNPYHLTGLDEWMTARKRFTVMTVPETASSSLKMDSGDRGGEIEG